MDQSASPMISVIVPVYNAAGQIERCVQSILNQTVCQIEVILVDDGSKDQSLALCRKLAETDDRITVVAKENEGAGAARNAGMERAKGKLLYFIDSDDWIEPTLLEKLIENIDLEDDSTMAICGRFREDNNGKHQRIWLPVVNGCEWKENDIPDCIANLEEANVFNYLWDRIYFRSTVERNKIRFDNWFTTGQDLDFNIQYFPHVTKCRVIMEPLYHYVSVSENPDSLCARFKPRLYEIISELCRRRAELHRAMHMQDNLHYQQILARECATHLHTVVPNMYRTDSLLSQKERKQIFEKLMSNANLCAYLRLIRWDDPLMKMFCRIILRHNAWLAEREYAAVFFFRNHTKRLYRYWRRHI
ncbi:MAG: glycosyltransferase [Oscillospiraceae bacterium]|nr:glycosyltransferase [Oscillospiraceae bacterium]